GSPAHPPGRAREVAPRRRPRPIGAPAPPPRFHARWNGVTIAVRYIPLPPPEYRFPSQEPANNTEDVVMHQRRKNLHNPGRRDFVRAGLGIAGGLALPYGLVSEAFAAEPQHPAIGTWPDGVKGNSVVVSIAVPRTGTYAVQGEDELKGWQLAIEHINEGHPLIRQISPKTRKGVLGKKLEAVIADSAAKPNNAVQAHQRAITENKAILLTGSTSSAVAVATNKLAQREKVLYVTGISGSNDTTGKDCVRYGFRQNFYGQTAAAAIGPVLLKAYGKNKKAAFMTPDYTYGHTVTKSVNDYLTEHG